MHIPVGFKAVCKWGQDDILFMTRRGSDGPEYRIQYFPHTAVRGDIAVIDWSADIQDSWSRAKTLLQPQGEENGGRGGSVKHLDRGPWWVFGLIDDSVQLAITNEDKRDVKAILSCTAKEGPVFADFARYLGWHPKDDSKWQWIVEEMMNQPLPKALSYYVYEGMVYWADPKVAGSTTWLHPYYDKYRNMLSEARKREVPYVEAAIMAFQIDLFITELRQQQLQGLGNAGGVQGQGIDSAVNAKEMARICKVKLRKEPFLVHIIKKMLRYFYVNGERYQRRNDIAHFDGLIQMYRDVVRSYKKQHEAAQEMLRSVHNCVECQNVTASIYCNSCRDLFCEVLESHVQHTKLYWSIVYPQTCFKQIHSTGYRKDHFQTKVHLAACCECGKQLAMFGCLSCNVSITHCSPGGRSLDGLC
eukprot:GHVS01086339.1.p1 GENE.GHVS01086339.1~~GHVS01086339.1.p1  ORF type:complete len:416 (+),score=35.09 GHVS01086339.1:144-1391(+)